MPCRQRSLIGTLNVAIKLTFFSDDRSIVTSQCRWKRCRSPSLVIRNVILDLLRLIGHCLAPRNSFCHFKSMDYCRFRPISGLIVSIKIPLSRVGSANSTSSLSKLVTVRHRTMNRINYRSLARNLLRFAALLISLLAALLYGDILGAVRSPPNFLFGGPERDCLAGCASEYSVIFVQLGGSRYSEAAAITVVHRRSRTANLLNLD